MNEPIIIGVIDASTSPDGSYAEMQLQLSDFTIQTLRFEPTTFLALVTKLFEMVVNQRMKSAAVVGHAAGQALPVQTTMALSAVGGSVVIVGMKLPTGLAVEFAVQPDEAEELHRQLGAAISKAKQQRASGRH